MQRPGSTLSAIAVAALVAPAIVWLLDRGGGPPGDPLAWAQVSSCGNAILEPGEQCEPPGSSSCPGLVTCNANCTCGPDHFVCYEVKRIPFSDQNVTVQDQFGTMTEQVRFPRRLCNPTNKNQEGIIDPTDHLVAYGLKAPRFTRQQNLTVTDQFGTLQLDAIRPDFLMVPASKDGVQQQDPLDHFQCYKAKRSRGAPKFAKRTVSVQNQFEGPTTLQVIKPMRLCAPANKNGEDPTAPQHPDHLICYKVKGARIMAGEHTIADQFGTDSVEVIRREELCVPASKNQATTTTTTSTTTSSSAQVTTTTSSTTTTSTTSSTTSTSTSTTTTTTVYGSPSRAFLKPVDSLLE